MEMTSHLPFPKTTASQPGKAQSQKPRHEENAGAEVASFPTLLQESHKTLKAGQKTESEKPVEEKPTGPTVLTVKIGNVEEPNALGTVGSVPGTEIKPVSSAPVAAQTIDPAEFSLVPQVSEDLQMSEVIQGQAVAVEISENEVPAEKASLGVATETLLNSNAAPEELSLSVDSQTSLPEKAVLQTEPVIVQSEAKAETKTSVEKEATSAQSIKSPEVIVAEKPIRLPVGEMTTKQVAPEKLPEMENQKIEIVEETSDNEESATPVVENPALAHQGASELDMLAAKANAEKVYQQPTISTENSHSTKTTLAALDLDSGSMDSEEQKESNITRIISSLKETSSPVKHHIRNQVLSRVVEHLQEEMSKEKLTIRLNPEKLGQVEVMFQAKGDQLEIIMSSSGKDAEQALQEGTRELAEKITDNSVRYNMVEIKVENRGQDQQTKQDSRQEEKRERQGNGQDKQNQHEGQRHQADHNHETGAGEWAAFHLGG